MGESKIIVVANQKGGAGKSTLCMLLANYLVQEIEMPLGAIIDTDFQQSIVKRREDDKVRLEGTDKLPPSYQVASFPISNHLSIPLFVKKLRENKLTYIIDTPGSLDNDGLASFLALADYIICPFDYDKLTLQATTEFLIFWNKIKEQIKASSGLELKTVMILVPCGKPKQVGTRLEKELWTLAAEGFIKLGYHIAPEIPESSSIRNCNTIELTPQQKEKSLEALTYIYDIIYNS